MPSFPQPGSVTVCEINRNLITAENLSDDRALETYAKILGTVFSPIQYEPENLLASAVASSEEPQRKSSLFSAALTAISTGSFRPFVQHADVKLLQDVDLHGLSWHQHKHMLAFISGQHHITIRDYEDSAEGKDPCILVNERQKDVRVLEWRPNAGKTLAVACKGGICIWSACYPGNMPCVRSGVTSGTLSRGSGTRWTLIDFLQSPDDETISALTWSPDGRYPVDLLMSFPFISLLSCDNLYSGITLSFFCLSCMQWHYCHHFLSVL
ncbi:hypothetical protein Leryth_021501 [Lithospermum erythrorhizon]|nr:hypothetical protein Leryth_021501 [Lithospermum erythrorhizon]